MASGGPRTPARPAPVSGPGALSRRTDGGPGQPIREPGDLPYGENAELRTQMQAAPMAAAKPTGRSSLPPDLMSMMGGGSTPMTAPTALPDEPLTTGMPFGPGAGPEVLASSVTKSGPTRAKLLANLKPMMRLAEQPDASPEFRAMVRYLRSQV